MQFTVLYLRLREELHSPLPPAEVVHRVQQVTVASAAFARPALRDPAPLFQGWTKPESFRICAFSEKNNRRRQSMVIVEGTVVTNDDAGSQLRLFYRPLLLQLFVLGFWLIFWGTLALAALLEWLRGPQLSFPWKPIAVPCAIYGLAVLLFWRDAHQNRQQLISLLDLKQFDARPIS